MIRKAEVVTTLRSPRPRRPCPALPTVQSPYATRGKAERPIDRHPPRAAHPRNRPLEHTADRRSPWADPTRCTHRIALRPSGNTEQQSLHNLGPRPSPKSAVGSTCCRADQRCAARTDCSVIDAAVLPRFPRGLRTRSERTWKDNSVCTPISSGTRSIPSATRRPRTSRSGSSSRRRRPRVCVVRVSRCALGLPKHQTHRYLDDGWTVEDDTPRDRIRPPRG